MAWVAAAGPLSNFLVAFLGLVALILVARSVSTPFIAEPLVGTLRHVYRFNLGLAIFNLLPLPPLDGGHFLPYVLHVLGTPDEPGDSTQNAFAVSLDDLVESSIVARLRLPY